MISPDDIDQTPEGLEVLGGYVCGHTDITLAEQYFIAVKRSVVNSQANIQGYPIIDDICFVCESEGEQEPSEDAYVMLDMCLTKKSGSALRIFIGYHSRKPMGLSNVKYEAATVDRYPQQVSSMEE